MMISGGSNGGGGTGGGGDGPGGGGDGVGGGGEGANAKAPAHGALLPLGLAPSVNVIGPETAICVPPEKAFLMMTARVSPATSR